MKHLRILIAAILVAPFLAGCAGTFGQENITTVVVQQAQPPSPPQVAVPAGSWHPYAVRHDIGRTKAQVAVLIRNDRRSELWAPASEIRLQVARRLGYAETSWNSSNAAFADWLQSAAVIEVACGDFGLDGFTLGRTTGKVFDFNYRRKCHVGEKILVVSQSGEPFLSTYCLNLLVPQGTGFTR